MTFLNSIKLSTVLSTVVVLVAFCMPISASAATTYHYTCSDFTVGGPWTCSSDILSASSWTSGGYEAYSLTGRLSSGTIWYLSATLTGSSGRVLDPVSGNFDHTFSTSLTDYQLKGTAFSGNGDLDFVTVSTASISDICVTDTIGACAGGGGGGGDDFATSSVGSYLIDDFNTFNSAGWSTFGASSPVLFSATTTGCYEGTGCVDAYDASQPVRAQLQMPALSSGSVFFAAKATVSGDTISVGVATSSMANSPANFSGSVTLTNDAAFHFIYLFWRNVVGDLFVQYCITSDDSNANDCPTWNDSTVVSGTYFTWVYFISSNGNFGGTVHHLVIDDVFSSAAQPSNGTSTAITGVTPAPDSVIASSTGTLFSASGNLNPSDYVPGEYVNIVYRQDTGACLTTFPPCDNQGSVSLPISTTGGGFTVSTLFSTPDSGIYKAYAVIDKPQYNIFGLTFGTQQVSTPIVWIFTVATSTQAEHDRELLGLTQFGFTPGVNASTTSTFSSTTAVCVSPASFNFTSCMQSLFTPDPLAVAQMKSQVFSVLDLYPWGVATRGIALLSGNATSSDVVAGVSATLPSLVIPISATGLAPATGAVSLNLTPWQLLMGSSSMLSTATDAQGYTFRQVVEPGWDFLVAALFGMTMVFQLLGLNVVGSAEKQSLNTRKRARN